MRAAGTFLLGLVFLILADHAHSDVLMYGKEEFKNVYVVQTDTMFYITYPETGKIVNRRKSAEIEAVLQESPTEERELLRRKVDTFLREKREAKEKLVAEAKAQEERHEEEKRLSEQKARQEARAREEWERVVRQNKKPMDPSFKIGTSSPKTSNTPKGPSYSSYEYFHNNPESAKSYLLNKMAGEAGVSKEEMRDALNSNLEARGLLDWAEGGF